MAPVAIQRILESGGRGFFRDQDDALLAALTAAIEEGRRTQGSNVARWDYGRYNLLTIKHPVGSRLPVFGSYFNIGPVEMSGSSTTIKQTSALLGPSMRFVADLGELGRIVEQHRYWANRRRFCRGIIRTSGTLTMWAGAFRCNLKKWMCKDTLVVLPK